MDGRTELINVFHDTQEFCAGNSILASAIEYGKKHTHLYEANDYPTLPSGSTDRQGRVSVIQARTFEAAISLHREFPGAKITVLNFASATHPGGGVKYGSRTQEESLCRCSTLYPLLGQAWLWEKFYAVNRAKQDRRHTDACIYFPEVVICKTDEDIPRRMDPKDFVRVDVIACSAPNLRITPFNRHIQGDETCLKISPEQLYDLHERRAKHILHIAAANCTDILILGAFGCGAFRNDPETVARAYHAVLKDYRDRFDNTIFAIYSQDREMESLSAFKKVFLESH